ncbi:MAG: hypothetical protein IT329_06220 [Caldilineaceae bacterium]|nr:hypothetical protein [Caldilineaceae bacterium]
MIKLQGRRAGVLIAWVLALLMLAGAAPVALAQGGPTAQRIQFPPGATGVTVDGYLNSGQGARYVLWARAGQTMTIQAWSDQQLVFVAIHRANGQLLGTTGGGQSWQGVLPADGDYYVTISTSAMGAGTDYSLRIDILSGPAPAPDAQPERIQFAPGSTSASVSGTMPLGSRKQYVLRALAGQVIDIQSWGVGAYRYALQTGGGAVLGEAAGGQSLFRTLPGTGDYLITLQTQEGTWGPIRYGLLVTITSNTPPPTPTPTPVPPPTVQEIRFPPGATSTTVWGTVSSSQPQAYRLAAGRGQMMTVQLRTEQGVPARVTIATDRGIFLGAANQGESWQGILPGTQDYFLTVQGPADAASANYALFVDIR